MSSPAAQQQHGAPYPPTMAGLGLIPTKSVDDPITSVFLVLFIIGAATHMTILQVNLRRGTKFIMSGMLFGFCMARITTCTMRLVWTTYITDVSIAIAAQIFVAAGVILLFIINLIFTQRVMRATHPDWAWTKAFSLAFKLYYASIVVMLVALITCTVQSFYTLDKNIKRIDRDVQLVGSTYFTVAAFLPMPLIALNAILPKPHRVEKFGEGRFRTKIYILLFSSFILTFGAAFRAGIAYVPRPRNNPAWYHSKACFYIFNFTIEIIVVALFAIIRVDKRFHIPNGSHGPGDYSGKKNEHGDANVDGDTRPNFLDRILSEEEVFDGEDVEGEKHRRNPQDLEMGNVDADVEKSRNKDDELSVAPSTNSGPANNSRLSSAPTLRTEDQNDSKSGDVLLTPREESSPAAISMKSEKHEDEKVTDRISKPIGVL